MNRLQSFWLGFCIGGMICSGILGVLLSSDWRAACIQRGAAEYDSKTGNWKWKIGVINERR